MVHDVRGWEALEKFSHFFSIQLVRLLVQALAMTPTLTDTTCTGSLSGPGAFVQFPVWRSRPVLWFVLGWIWGASVSAQPLDFVGPYDVPIPSVGSIQHQLARNPVGNAAFDSSGTLHLVSWDGSLATTPVTPSRVWWHRWSRSSGWTPGQQVDDSRTTPAGIVVGGRQPSLLLSPLGQVTITWHDHRHCTAAGNWIDNVEIYGQQFSTQTAEQPTPPANNIRLTQTASAGQGDNGFAPRQATLPDGRLVTVWYDYGFLPGISDLMVGIGPATGILGPGPFNLGSVRKTTALDRSNDPAFTLPDVAVTPDGVLHLCWMGGVGVGDLYTATLPPPYTTLTSPSVLAIGVADFLDPPRIGAGPNGDVWVVAKDASAADAGQVTLWRKPVGQGSYGLPLRPVLGAGPRSFPSMVFTASGSLILALADRSGSQSIRVVRLDSLTAGVVEQQVLSPPGNYSRVALATTAVGVVPEGLALVAEEITGLNSSRLRHWSTLAPAAARGGWELYE
jgi:hypothetical protein